MELRRSRKLVRLSIPGWYPFAEEASETTVSKRYVLVHLDATTSTCTCTALNTSHCVHIKVAEKIFGTSFENDHQYHYKSTAEGNVAVDKATENVYAVFDGIRYSVIYKKRNGNLHCSSCTNIPQRCKHTKIFIEWAEINDVPLCDAPQSENPEVAERLCLSKMHLTYPPSPQQQKLFKKISQTVALFSSKKTLAPDIEFGKEFCQHENKWSTVDPIVNNWIRCEKPTLYLLHNTEKLSVAG